MGDTKETKGAIYITTDDSYLDEAIKSAKSLKRNNPDLEATLYTDTDVECEIFDQIKKVKYSITDTQDSILKPFMTPYDKNLYLDTDTYVTGDISELFEILDNFDVAASHAPGRKRVQGTPECFREYNTGVIAFRKSDEIKETFRRWEELYEEIQKTDLEVGIGHDQHPFAKTIFESNLDFFTLPPEYNTRLPRCGYSSGEVKILHGRPRTSMEKIEKTINSTEKSRVHYATQSFVGSGRKIKVFSKTYALEKGLKLLFREGPRKALIKFRKYLRRE